MISMLGAMLGVPMTAANALASAVGVTAQMSGDDAHTMPCHKVGQNAAKPCPHCPQKSCADMGGCLVKCFQTLAAPVTDARVERMDAETRAIPEPAQVLAGSLIPPLLRPPSF